MLKVFLVIFSFFFRFGIAANVLLTNTIAKSSSATSHAISGEHPASHLKLVDDSTALQPHWGYGLADRLDHGRRLGGHEGNGHGHGHGHGGHHRGHGRHLRDGHHHGGHHHGHHYHGHHHH